MKIVEIRVEGLFGMFNHTIPLNEDGLTVVYGENGIGKTMLFKLLHYTLNEEFEELSKISFQRFIIQTNDNNSLILSKDTDKNITFTLNDSIIPLEIQDEELPRLANQVIAKNPDKFERLRTRFVRNKTTGKILRLLTFVREHYHFSPEGADDFPNLSPSFLIQTQRLYSIQKTEKKRGSFSDRKTKTKTTVQIYSEELSNIIEHTHNQYQVLSETLELSLSKRLISKKVSTKYNPTQLLEDIEVVKNRRKELKAVGLLENQDDELFEFTEELDAIAKAIISVNIQDQIEKLKVFDELYVKLDLFLTIINNRRFTYKELHISEKNGFIIKNQIGEIISPSDLSSGEQHELILIYNLLFKVPEGALILIDEPEISLHVVWQKEFLNDIQEIIKLRKIDVVVATHSPSIINGNWDLTVHLKGVEANA